MGTERLVSMVRIPQRCMLTIAWLDLNYDRLLHLFSFLLSIVALNKGVGYLFKCTVIKFVKSTANSYLNVLCARVLFSLCNLGTHWVALFNFVKPRILTSEKVAENLEWISHELVASLLLTVTLESSNTIMIIDLSQLWITQDFICLRYFGESGCKESLFGSWIPQWVQLERETSIGLGNLLGVCFSRYFQLVVVT